MDSAKHNATVKQKNDKLNLLNNFKSSNNVNTKTNTIFAKNHGYKNKEIIYYNSTGVKIGGLNETYTTWGNEDTELWERFHKNGFTIVRNRAKILHHWHSSHNPKYEFMNEA